MPPGRGLAKTPPQTAIPTMRISTALCFKWLADRPGSAASSPFSGLENGKVPRPHMIGRLG